MGLTWESKAGTYHGFETPHCLLKTPHVLSKHNGDLEFTCSRCGLSCTFMINPPSFLSISMEREETRRYLLSIRNMAESLMGLTRPKGTTTTKVIPTTNTNISIPILNLPFPNDLGPTLRTLGLGESAYLEAYRKIQDWVHNLQNIHSLNFQRACRELASLPHFQNHRSLASAIEDIRFTYQKSYASYLPSITSYILSAQSKQNSYCKSAKTPFNNVSVKTPFPELC